METRLLTKKNVFSLILVILLCACFFLSLFLFIKKDYGTRRVFIFPETDSGRLVLETRCLGENPFSDAVTDCVSELLLGPGIERTKRLFAPGTRVLSCFERQGRLYLNLSKDLLLMGDNVVDIKEGIELLDRNIRKNFHNISEVILFVDGIYAFEYSKSLLEE